MTEPVSVDQALAWARQQLGTTSPTALMDAEILLLALVGKSRSWLYGFGDSVLEPTVVDAFTGLVERRQQGEPVAYLVGHREFYGLDISVSPATLIPRPDTELLVDTALELATTSHGNALDLGTGSGAIALAFAAQRPGWQVTGIDRVAEAVALARTNAERLGLANTRWLESDWFQAPALAGQRYQLILSNPPYIAPADHHLHEGDVRFEPASALVAQDDGMADLYAILTAATQWLEPNGWLLLEHGFDQGDRVRQSLLATGYVQVGSVTDLAGHERVTLGQWACT